MNDLELIKKAVQLVGGKQQSLAHELGVKPSAVSNWVNSGKLPDRPRMQLVELIGRIEALLPADGVPIAPAVAPPDRLRSDADHCGYWAESAWCLNYVADPRSPNIETTDTSVWRTWNRIHVLRSTTFRHFFRYKPLADSKPRTADSKPLYGFGFLSAWAPKAWEMAQSSETTIKYLNANAALTPTTRGFGGYFVSAQDSIWCHEGPDRKYEFVGFRTECPVRQAHLVVSLPRSLRGTGPIVAYLMSADFPMFFHFGRQISDNQGELERIIEPWGRVLSHRRLIPEHLQISDRSVSTDITESWVGAVGPTQDPIVQEVLSKFAPDSSRDHHIVTVEHPPPLTTILLYWPLPNTSAQLRKERK